LQPSGVAGEADDTSGRLPPLQWLRVCMPRILGERFAHFIREKGRTAEEGVKILLAYGADALTLPDRTFSEVFNEWAAARAAAGDALRTRPWELNRSG